MKLPTNPWVILFTVLIISSFILLLVAKFYFKVDDFGYPVWMNLSNDHKFNHTN
jgi:hypothetical protein